MSFQGELRVETQQVIVRPDEGSNQKPQFDIDRGEQDGQYSITFLLKLLNTDIKTTTSPFLYLALDLPPPPLFQDSVEKNIIPQVSIASVLSKFDGKTTQVYQQSPPWCTHIEHCCAGINGPAEAV